MLFVPPFSLDSADEVCGIWTREQLVAMDAAFVARVEAAFQSGLESRADGRQRQLKMDAAIGAAWRWFEEVKFQAMAVEVMARVRAICPDVAVERVREELWQRLMHLHV